VSVLTYLCDSLTQLLTAQSQVEGVARLDPFTPDPQHFQGGPRWN